MMEIRFYQPISKRILVDNAGGVKDEGGEKKRGEG